MEHGPACPCVTCETNRSFMSALRGAKPKPKPPTKSVRPRQQPIISSLPRMVDRPSDKVKKLQKECQALLLPSRKPSQPRDPRNNRENRPNPPPKAHSNFPGRKMGSIPAVPKKNLSSRAPLLLKKASKIVEEGEENPGPQGLTLCRHCGRGFLDSRILKHQNVCAQVFGRKRRRFNSKTQRGYSDGCGEIPSRHLQSFRRGDYGRSLKTVKNETSWREKSAAFREAMQEQRRVDAEIRREKAQRERGMKGRRDVQASSLVKTQREGRGRVPLPMSNSKRTPLTSTFSSTSRSGPGGRGKGKHCPSERVRVSLNGGRKKERNQSSNPFFEDPYGIIT